MPTNHRSIQTDPAALPDGLQNSYEKVFRTPGLNTATRPVLSYRVTPSGGAVTLQIDLNDTTVVDETFNSTSTRSLLEIVDHGLANEGENTLTIRREAGPGTFTISDILFLYSQD